MANHRQNNKDFLLGKIKANDNKKNGEKLVELLDEENSFFPLLLSTSFGSCMYRDCSLTKRDEAFRIFIFPQFFFLLCLILRYSHLRCTTLLAIEKEKNNYTGQQHIDAKRDPFILNFPPYMVFF